MSLDEGSERFILLPGRGLRGNSPLVSTRTHNFLSTLSLPEESEIPNEVKVVDSISNSGAKLVELSPSSLEKLRKNQPGIQIVPLQFYTPALAPRPTVRILANAFNNSLDISLRVKVKDEESGNAIPSAKVIAFTNFGSRVGASAITDLNGEVQLLLGGSLVKVERLYVYPQLGFWPLLSREIQISDGLEIKLTPINLSTPDLLRDLYNEVDLSIGLGVRVGVVDTGIQTHPDLDINGGFNSVPGENPSEFGDNGEGHGTHVAGIIAARGKSPQGVRGLAPAVELRSYRVFGTGEKGASNYAIAKAIDQALQDECDILNLSLGGGAPDPAIKSAINDARQAGCVVICASGNDNRSPVSYPASEALALAVSAFGREGTYPDQAEQFGNIQRPPSAKNNLNYITSFSNVGPELDLVGPGDGIISTFPGGYAVMNGTSMACPAVTGRAAALLSANKTVLEMKRDVNRSDAIVQILTNAALPLGFGQSFEGNGLLP